MSAVTKQQVVLTGCSVGTTTDVGVVDCTITEVDSVDNYRKANELNLLNSDKNTANAHSWSQRYVNLVPRR